jgi:hypothetical protein
MAFCLASTRFRASLTSFAFLACATGATLFVFVGCAAHASSPVAPVVVVVGDVPTSALAVTATEPANVVGATRRAVGDEVDVEWNGSWWPAVLVASQPAGMWLVHYEGYGDDWDESVSETRIRERGIVEDDERMEDPDEDDGDP